jgi:hypothetical protein
LRSEATYTFPQRALNRLQARAQIGQRVVGLLLVLQRKAAFEADAPEHAQEAHQVQVALAQQGVARAVFHILQMHRMHALAEPSCRRYRVFARPQEVRRVDARANPVRLPAHGVLHRANRVVAGVGTVIVNGDSDAVLLT